MIQLRILGPADIVGPPHLDAGSILGQPKRLALLAYLAVAPDDVRSRDTMLGLLWPDLDQQRARNALSQALHVLKTALGPDVFSTGRGRVGISREALSCDVVDFRQALEEKHWERALELYRGDLLDGLYVPSSGEFERWLDGKRERLRRRATRAALEAVELLSGQGLRKEARAFAFRAATLAPYDEAVHRALIRLLDRQGDRAGALRSFEEFSKRLAEDLDAKPSPETVELFDAVRARSDLHPAAASGSLPEPRGARPASSPASKPSDAGSDRDRPLPRQRRPARGWRPVAWLGTATLVGWGAYTAVVGRTRTSEPAVSLDEDLIAVAPFDVVGVEVDRDLWGQGLAQLVSRHLDGAGPLRSLGSDAVFRAWDTRHADRDQAMDLGVRLSAGLVAFGTVLSLGADSIRAETRLIDVATGEMLADVVVREANVRIDAAADSTAIRLLREIGQTRPVTAALGRSLGAREVAAIREFLKGEQFFRSGQYERALGHYQRAVRVDSTFAQAYHRLSRAAASVGQVALVESSAVRAAAFNVRLPARESLLIVADALSHGLFDRQDSTQGALARRLIETLEETTRRYPADVEAWWHLGTQRRRFGGLLDIPQSSSLSALERAIAVDPLFGPTYPDAVRGALALGRSQDALAWARTYLSLEEESAGKFSGAMTIVERALAADAGEGQPPDSLISAAPADVLHTAYFILERWLDDAETELRIARAHYASPPSRHPIADRPDVRSRGFAGSLAYRGRAREAYEAWPSIAPMIALVGPFLADLDVVPEDSTLSIVQRSLARGGGAAVHQMLPWLADRGHISVLSRYGEVADSIVSAAPSPRLGQESRYLAGAARAYSELAVGDSAAALERLRSLDALACPGVCEYDRLTSARLLRLAGRLHEAASLLEGEPGNWLGFIPDPVEIWWQLERARVADLLGDRETAAAAYRRVVAAWRRADDALQPVVAEADEALSRLGEGGPR